MSAALDALITTVRDAFRQEWRTTVKGQTTSSGIAATVDGYTRTVGSFITDGLDIGDEYVAAGWANAGNNGMGWIVWMDALTLKVIRPAATTMVVEAAGPAVTLTVSMPTRQYFENWKKNDLETPYPWAAEKHQPGVITPASLRAPTAMVRLVGVYWLSLFYPADAGTTGVERLRGKTMAVIYPARTIVYNGQQVRVQRAVPKDYSQDAEWVGAPIAWHYQADTINPA